MALSFFRVVAAAICAVTLVFADSSFSPAFNYGTDKVRGVNLGGWLVLEVRSLLLRISPLLNVF